MIETSVRDSVVSNLDRVEAIRRRMEDGSLNLPGVAATLRLVSVS